MNRRKWLWAALMAAPLAIGGGLVYAKAQASPYVCPITGEGLPCERCCPLNQAKGESFTCPLTGEELECEACCPLNKKK
jgi:hypothetical protein